MLSERATAAYEGAREKVRAFINAASVREIVFTRNATESINLVARAWGDANVGRRRRGAHHRDGAPLEHRAVAAAVRAHGRDAARSRRSTIAASCSMDEFERLITPRTKMVAVVHLSNALGTVNPVADDRRAGAACGRGGADRRIAGGVPHADRRPARSAPTSTSSPATSSTGPTGIGVLHGREAVLDAMPPFLGGGDMIRTVTFEGSTWNDLPYKFEAGTPNIAGAVGLGAAIDYVTRRRLRRASTAHEAALRRRTPPTR